MLTATQSAGSNVAAIVGETVLLALHNNRFTDDSATPKIITPAGDVSVRSFSPFRPTAIYNPETHGGSTYFGTGSTDYLTLPAGPNFSYGTGDFTIDCWIYPIAVASSGSAIWTQTVAGTNYFLFGYGTDYSVGFTGTLSGGGTNIASAADSKAPLNAWSHVAVVRTSGSVRVYVNGRGGTATSNTVDFSNTTYVPTIGRYTHQGTNVSFAGYISGLRLSRKALFTGNFTVPTTPAGLTQVSSTNIDTLTANVVTAFLGFTNSGIYDATARHNFQSLGDVKVANVSSKFGAGSLYFDGTSDAITEPYNPLYAFGTGDFTIEFWINFSSKTGYQTIMSFGYTTPIAYGWIIQTGNGDGNLIFYYQAPGVTSTVVATESGSTVNTGTWYHVAIVRTGGNTKIYRNGAQVATGADSYSYLPATTARFYIGGGSNAGFDNYYFNGYLDDIRITQYARYTGAFTAPTQAFLTK